MTRPGGAPVSSLRFSSALLALLLLSPAAHAKEQRPRLDRVKSIVVMIHGQRIPGTGHPFFGAGIIIGRDGNDLLVLTRLHIVQNDSGTQVASIEAMTWWRQDAWQPATLIGQEDADLDLALLRIPGGGRGAKPAQAPDFKVLGNARDAFETSDVYSVSYRDEHAWDLLPCPQGFTALSPDGIITFKSSEVHPGISGGVLLDSRRRVIGIVKSDNGTSGYALAIHRVLSRLQAWHRATALRRAPASKEDSDPDLVNQERMARQSLLQEAKQQPQFRFVQTRTSIDSESFDSLELWNDGPAFESYMVWQGSYLQVSGLPDMAPPARRYIPAYYFHDRKWVPDAKTGLLVTFLAWQDGTTPRTGLNETREYERLVTDVRKRLGMSVYITKRVFLMINYVDHAKVGHQLIYEIYPPLSTFRPSTPVLVQEKLDLRMVLTRDLRNLTADNLLLVSKGFGVLTDLGEDQGGGH